MAALRLGYTKEVSAMPATFAFPRAFCRLLRCPLHICPCTTSSSLFRHAATAVGRRLAAPSCHVRGDGGRQDDTLQHRRLGRVVSIAVTSQLHLPLSAAKEAPCMIMITRRRFCPREQPHPQNQLISASGLAMCRLVRELLPAAERLKSKGEGLRRVHGGCG